MRQRPPNAPGNLLTTRTSAFIARPKTAKTKHAETTTEPISPDRTGGSSDPRHHRHQPRTDRRHPQFRDAGPERFERHDLRLAAGQLHPPERRRIVRDLRQRIHRRRSGQRRHEQRPARHRLCPAPQDDGHRSATPLQRRGQTLHPDLHPQGRCHGTRARPRPILLPDLRRGPLPQQTPHGAQDAARDRVRPDPPRRIESIGRRPVAVHAPHRQILRPRDQLLRRRAVRPRQIDRSRLQIPEGHVQDLRAPATSTKPSNATARPTAAPKPKPTGTSTNTCPARPAATCPPSSPLPTPTPTTRPTT